MTDLSSTSTPPRSSQTECLRTRQIFEGCTASTKNNHSMVTLVLLVSISLLTRVPHLAEEGHNRSLPALWPLIRRIANRRRSWGSLRTRRSCYPPGALTRTTTIWPVVSDPSLALGSVFPRRSRGNPNPHQHVFQSDSGSGSPILATELDVPDACARRVASSLS